MTTPATPSAPAKDDRDATPALPKLSRGPARTTIEGGTPSGRSSAIFAAISLALGGALLGYAAIVIGWAVTESSGVADARSLGPVALYTAVLGTVYATIVSAASDVRARIWDRALVRAVIGAFVGLVVGAASGAISQVLFDALQTTQDPGAVRYYVLRALSWAAFGVGIGLVGGIAEQSGRKTVNGLVGGLIGGALGGVVFHWVGQHVDSASEARLMGLAAIGTCTGAAIGLVEGARRQAWVRVLAGGMAGKEFILYHDLTTIGSAPKCQITLIKDPKAAPFHAQVVTEGARRVLTPLEGSAVVVNGAPIRSRPLRSGDQIQIGATTLLYQERD